MKKKMLRVDCKQRNVRELVAGKRGPGQKGNILPSVIISIVFGGEKV